MSQWNFETLLVANRGEIACRIMRTARRMGLATVAVHSEADANALHVRQADQAVCIGPTSAAQSYLNIDAVLSAAASTGAQAIHPGYGFLSENAEFAEACEAAGIVYVGPGAKSIRAMGLKDAAKQRMQEAGVPVVPGYHGEDQSPARLRDEAERVGYPVLIKARAGGGGKGMRLVASSDAFVDALASARREAQASFGDDAVLVEKFIESPRHVEVQVFGDQHGQIVHLYERDCSLQRRHQKVIEEAPAPGINDAVRAAMTEAAVTAARAIDYVGAGTIEFIADGSGPLRADGFWFMEMNTRLQVEHPVTEAITGVDLVEWQLRVAAGQRIPLTQDQIPLFGHAMEARLYAEDAAEGFLPAAGRLERLRFASGGRIDSAVVEGDEVLPFYDPMLAKFIAHGDTRDEARSRLLRLLAETVVLGTVTNRAFLHRLAQTTAFADGQVHTGLIDEHFTELVSEEAIRIGGTGAPEVLTALAALWLVARPTGDGSTSAERLGLWQLWGEPCRRVRFEQANKVEECEVRRLNRRHWSVTVDQCSPISLTPDERWWKEGAGTCEINGVRMAADCLLHRSVTEGTGSRASLVSVRLGAHSQTLRLESWAGRSGGDANDNILKAPMPGRIVQVHVATGERVNAGQVVLTLEAMKMEHDLAASSDAEIVEIGVSAGKQVSQGDELMRFE